MNKGLAQAFADAFGLALVEVWNDAKPARRDHPRHFVVEFVDEGQRNRRQRRRARKAHAAMLRQPGPPTRRSMASIIGSYVTDLPRVDIR